MKLKYKKLDEIYKQVPEMECKGLCHTTCTYFWASEAEQERLMEVYGFNPVLPKEETKKRISEYRKHSCAALKDGKCSVYPIRPLICRIWGHTKKLACKHGCKPKKQMSQEKADKLMVKAKYFPKNQPKE